MRAAAIIPARGGSRRIPRKNIRDFRGCPIIAYSIETAIGSGLFDAGVWVSTEDPEIASIAWKYGAKVHPRQKDLAVDEVGTQEVMRRAIAELWPGRIGAGDERYQPPAYACCIYPCAPLATVGDLRIGYGMLASGVTHYVYATDLAGKGAGQWYWGAAQSFLDSVPLEPGSQHYVLPPERVCDIDTEEDWLLAEQLYDNATRRGDARKGTARDR